MVDVVVLDAPTGSGKTLIAESVRQGLGVAAVYVCTTKTLQEQFVGDYPYCDLLKGRANYVPTHGYGNATCADCNKVGGGGGGGEGEDNDDSCTWCQSVRLCPYEVAKRAAIRSPLPVLNTAYYLTEANGPGRFAGRELVVVDEADTLEQQIMGYVEVYISEGRVDKYGIGTPEKVTVAESWREWLDSAIPTLKKVRAQGKQGSLSTGNELRGNQLRAIREGKYLNNTLSKLERIRAELDDDIWVYTGDRARVAFKPVRVDSIAGNVLWQHGRKHLLMSGTVISAQEMLGELGWKGDYRVVTCPSVFPAKNRRVVVEGVGNMSRKGGEDDRQRVRSRIRDIIREYPTDRILVHSVSYDLTSYLKKLEEHEDRPFYSYATSGDRDSTLRAFVGSDNGVMIAPSFSRGVDLPGDLCRVQIIAKVPFPYLGDKQVSARLHGKNGQLWYHVQTVRTIVQMCGRAVRGVDDYAVTYVLDSQFREFFGKCRQLFPSWWKEALDWQ